MSCLVSAVVTDPLDEESLPKVLSELRRALEGRVDEAYLFGSVATGRYARDSDIDLILVKKSDRPFTERGLEFLDLFDVFPRLDLLVYTPEEFERQRQSADVGFWRHVTRELRPLFPPRGSGDGRGSR